MWRPAILGNGRTRPARGRLRPGADQGVSSPSALVCDAKRRTTPHRSAHRATLPRASTRVVSRPQLDRRLAWDEGAIAWRVREGRLHRVHRGVYAVGHPVLPRYGRLMAAVLACGQGAVLSHRSAAELLADRAACGIRGGDRGGREGLATGRDPRPPRQRPRRPPRRHRGHPGRPPRPARSSTSPTCSRGGGSSGPWTRPSSCGSTTTVCAPFRGAAAPGCSPRCLPGTSPARTRTRSELEEKFLTLCRSHLLTQPETNAHVDGHEVDFIWRGATGRVDGEPRRPGFSDRGSTGSWSGYRVMRFTQLRLERDPAAVADELRRAGAPVEPGRWSRSRAARRRRPRP